MDCALPKPPAMTTPLGFALLALLLAGSLEAQPVGTLDLATVAPGDGVYRRVLGSVGNGASGVPVAGGYDIDGDGHADSAFSAMRASPQGRNQAGVVFLVFGDSGISGEFDTAIEPHPNILEIHGDQVQEHAGSEIWMADVTGDGLGDLIICRQDYSPGGTRIGAGALTLLPGNAMLRTMAANNEILDLRAPPVGLPVVTIHGAMQTSRFCIWARNGDVTGDGIDDLAVGADREVSNGQSNSGAVYVIRGGSHLATSQIIDLANFGTVSVGNIARMVPSVPAGGPASTMNFHFGATVQVADLDGNGRAEVLAAAALNRAGAALAPLGGSGKGSGGSPQGTLYIAWDDNFLGDWIPAPDFVLGTATAVATVIDGGIDNDVFGEEILGGKDYDNDGNSDLFVGDLTSNGWGPIDRFRAGVAHVIYDISSYKNMAFDIDAPPPGFTMATFVGPTASAIAGDTALHGDFNGDGIDDLAFSSPQDNPLGRGNAGTLHILFGQNGPWPVLSDLAPANYPASGVSIFEIYGANVGDVLCYSAADGDMNGDGRTDLIVNEMLGDGSSTSNVGNLLVIDSAALFPRPEVIFADGFEASD
jgi:hypothetical protein